MKLAQLAASQADAESPPARGRGLKRKTPRRRPGGNVAPRAGAWIETQVILRREEDILSPPARGRGLKRGYRRGPQRRVGRPPRGGVD